MGYQSILVTLDGSELAERAVDCAAAAAVPGARLHILSVIEDAAEVSTPVVSVMNADFALQYRQQASSQEVSALDEVAIRHDYVNWIKDALAKQGYDVTAEVRPGRVVDTIVETARDFELLVMATHGRTGLSKLALGSVTEAALHRTTCPLLIAPAHTPPLAPPDRHTRFHGILISLDGTPESEAILPEVEKLLLTSPAKIVLLRVAPPIMFDAEGLSADDYALLINTAERDLRLYLDRVGERLKGLGATPIVEASFNSPVEEIRAMAEYYQVDLIAMATHGRVGISRLLHGSVTEQVLHCAHCPLLIVRMADG